VLTSYSYQTW